MAANPGAIEPVAPSAESVHQEADELRTEFQGPAARLPVELDVMIPVRNFRVRDLLTLASGTLIESQWANGDDLPISAGDVQLAWSEFEVVDTELAVRITRLA